MNLFRNHITLKIWTNDALKHRKLIYLRIVFGKAYTDIRVLLYFIFWEKMQLSALCLTKNFPFW